MGYQSHQKTRKTPPASPDEGQLRVLVKHLHARGLNRPEKEPTAPLSGPLAGTAYGVSQYLYGQGENEKREQRVGQGKVGQRSGQNKGEQWGGRNKGERRGGQGKEANASGVNRQGLKPSEESYWTRSAKEKRTIYSILYGRGG